MLFKICSVVPVVNTPVNLSKGSQTPNIKKEPGEIEKVEIKQEEKNVASLLSNTPVCGLISVELFEPLANIGKFRNKKQNTTICSPIFIFISRNGKVQQFLS